MLWTIFVILLVLWLLGLVSSYTLGGFIHILSGGGGRGTADPADHRVADRRSDRCRKTPASRCRASATSSNSISKEDQLKRSLIALIFSLVALLGSMALATAKEDSVERLQNAGDVLKEIMDAPDKGIPEEVLDNAKCIVVVPHLIKAGFIFGGKHGRGVASCRTATGWSAPAFISVGGGSWGLQIGAEGVDLVMLVMNDKGLQHLLSSKFQLSGEGSAAAGPVGRHASAGTDWKMNAELLTYSRSKGAFAGLTLEGAVIEQDCRFDHRHLWPRCRVSQSPHRRREGAGCGCALHVRTFDGRPSGRRPRSQGRHAGQEISPDAESPLRPPAPPTWRGFFACAAARA